MILCVASIYLSIPVTASFIPTSGLSIFGSNIPEVETLLHSAINSHKNA